MTVEELREKLRDLDDELHIVFDDGARFMSLDGVKLEQIWNSYTRSQDTVVVLH